ncbi:MAG: hypothetical protein GY730_08605 [bacterium]|nr:hypothetical protein [bacterium]
MAKIEARSKDVNEHKLELLLDPQHLYFIYTDDKGSKEIIRGGAEGDNPFGRGELLIVKQSYNKPTQDDGSKTYDWDDGTHISEVIANGDEKEVKETWDKMWEKGQEINEEKYDYEVFTQNSNTAVVQISKSVGLENKVKQFIDANSIKALADDAELEHSLIDRAYDIADTLNDGIIKTYGSIQKFKETLQELNKNPYSWLSLIAKTLQMSLEELLGTKVKQLIDELLGQINPLKSVVVIEESDTGRNEIFVDQLMGKAMNRDVFVSQINTGNYPGYKVALMHGIDTPMSKADEVLSNNLG